MPIINIGESFDFKKFIADNRKKMNWSQETLAIESGIPQSMISKYEAGTLKIPLMKFAKIAGVFGYQLKIAVPPKKVIP